MHRFLPPLLVAALTYSVPLGAQMATPSPATSPSVTNAVAAVQRFYNQSSTFESDFEQRLWVKAYDKRMTSHGHVTFAKPGKMDWQYAESSGNRIVSDGTVVKVFEPADKQIYEQSVANSQYPAALSFLLGTGTLSASFNFLLPSEMNLPGGFVLVGTPKQPAPSVSKVLFYVDAATSQVRRVAVIDGQGNRNTFDFLNPVINQPVPASRFQFTPPPGTSVVHP